ncbi:MAG: right-handed parallel beta-helix repeat-containing protein [Candidatus Eisenbacteria sp.]|nr:right-handed parallel beta-helix repeat-containing protein [Candidatus Eisenbacteria bacterium]
MNAFRSLLLIALLAPLAAMVSCAGTTPSEEVTTLQSGAAGHVPSGEVTTLKPDAAGHAPSGEAIMLQPGVPGHPPSGADLQQAVARAATIPGVTIAIPSGEYHLVPQPYLDPTCGNCEDSGRSIPATLGLRITGEGITIRGTNADSVVIHTHAGYGLLFEDCIDCRLEGVTVTGGERDTSGMATDAAIVVRRSSLTIHRCWISENLGDSATVAATVVGIMGICGREDARIRITDCRILRNSWDGIALYRDAEAYIENCIIDGVDSGRGGPNRGGRGVAIGITWNARATVVGNLIRRYWKGIGIFVDAQASVRENVIENLLTWGVALWDAEKGRPYGEIVWNAVYQTGACGISVTRGLAGGREISRVAHNALTLTGRNERYDDPELYCTQEALALHALGPAIAIGPNHFYANREAEDRAGQRDESQAAFHRGIAPLLERLAQRPVLRKSEFLKVYGNPETQ